MKLKSIFSAALVACALAGAGSANAVVFPDFKVDKTDTGNTATAFTADKITGNYVEVITFGAGTFDITLKWQAAAYVANDGVDPLGGVLTGLATDGLYALFRGSGTFSSVGGVFSFNLNPGGSLNVYLDKGQDTTFTTPGLGTSPWGVTQNVADILLATGSGILGSGNLNTGCSGGINCGSFGQTTSFLLTAAGKNYFVDPIPFYNLSLQSGQFNNFNVTGTQVINGSMDVVFAVPEPATLALAGVALLGLGLSRRRKA